MESSFKFTAGLLLLFQTLHPTLLQRGMTVSPGRPIEMELLHVSPNSATGSQAQSAKEPSVGDQDVDTIGMASGVDQTHSQPNYLFAISSGASEENQEHNNNGKYEGMTVNTTLIPSTFPNDTNTMEAIVSTTPAAPLEDELTMQFSPSTTVYNGSNPEDIFQNHTDVPSEHPDDMTTDGFTITKYPNANGDGKTHGINGSNEQTNPEKSLNTNDIEETTSGISNFLSTTRPGDGQTVEAPLTPTTPTPPPETSVNEVGPVTMTTLVFGTTEKSNATDRDEASRESNTDRGFASNSNTNKKNKAWAAILGTAVVVSVMALVIFVILKKKNQKDFSHRKLVEFSSDPVLRLDNSESLDPNYARGAYHNPALQMTSIPPRYSGPIQDVFLD